jgi:tetratricopeptide (TPR) repeat protein
MAGKPRRRPRSETKGKFRPLLVRMLAVWYDMTWKQLSAALDIAQSKLSQHLKRGEVKDDLFDRILAAMRSRPVVVLILKGCIETLEALTRVPDLSEDELLTIERAAQGSARRTREGLAEIARLSRRIVPAGYPGALDLKPLRRRADELWARLKDRTVAFWSVAVEAGEEFQSWSFCEKVCELSVREASRDLKRATALARLAVKIAERVQGPGWWQSRVLGYAMAHQANILRVAGHLQAADALLEKAKKLWEAGADPNGVLDPGRLPNLEGALRRDQRRFAEALACHGEAFSIGRFPVLALIQKGYTLEVMGDYERAVEVLWAAEPLVERQPERHLKYMLPFNLAVNLTHVGRFHEAMALVQQVRELVIELGDEINLYRVIWIEGRVAAGLGHSWKARKLLVEAREKFAAEKMSFDVVLALLEEAVLLLEEGRTAEVRKLAEELTEIFQSKGVHREALAALRLFKDAVECERATADLARGVLNYFFRARYDQSLQFTAS